MHCQKAAVLQVGCAERLLLADAEYERGKSTLALYDLKSKDTIANAP